MKKFLIILLSLVLSVSMFVFAACSDTPVDNDPQTGTETQPPHTAGDPDSDTLVVELAEHRTYGRIHCRSDGRLSR